MRGLMRRAVVGTATLPQAVCAKQWISSTSGRSAPILSGLRRDIADVISRICKARDGEIAHDHATNSEF